MKTCWSTLSRTLTLAAILCQLGHRDGSAMEHNLAGPWGDRCSPPQTPLLSFRSPQSEDMLFAEGATIEIVCQSGLRSVALTWSLHRNMVQKPFREGKAEPLLANRFRIAIATAGLHPGFYDLLALDVQIHGQDVDLPKYEPLPGYYDPMNFAPAARCPVLFNAGLIDPVSPPYSVFAAYLRWGGTDKTMMALDGLGHDWCAEFDRRAFRWLDRVLGGTTGAEVSVQRDAARLFNGKLTGGQAAESPGLSLALERREWIDFWVRSVRKGTVLLAPQIRPEREAKH